MEKLSLREAMKNSCIHSASQWQKWNMNLDWLASQVSAFPAKTASREMLLCIARWKPEEFISLERCNRMKTQVASPRVRKSWLTDPLWIAEGNWGCSRKVPALGNNQVLPQPVLPDPIRLLGWNHSVVGPEDGSNISQMAEQEDVSLVCLETSAWWPKEVEGEGGEGSGWIKVRRRSFCPSESSRALLARPPSEHLPLMTATTLSQCVPSKHTQIKCKTLLRVDGMKNTCFFPALPC